MFRFRRAFTLVELLVVIAIIGVLVALILPAVQAAREMARRATCTNHLTKLIIGIHQYEATHLVYPPGTLADSSPIENLPSGNHHNWLGHILPHVDQQVAAKNLDLSVSVYDLKNAAVLQGAPKLVFCPSSANSPVGYSDYAAAHHDQEAPIDETNNGVFYLNSKLTYDDLQDGASTTLFLGEKLTDSFDLGWLSGTRATLRNGGTPLNHFSYNDGLPRPGYAGYGNPGSVRPDSKPVKFDPPPEPPIEPRYDLGPGIDPGAAGFPPSPYDPPVLPSAPDVDPAEPAVPPSAPPTPIPLPAMNDRKYVGGFGSSHPLGANFAFGDGSVKFLDNSMPQAILQALINRQDGKLAQQP